jgi:hypothetical protein
MDRGAHWGRRNREPTSKIRLSEAAGVVHGGLGVTSEVHTYKLGTPGNVLVNG